MGNAGFHSGTVVGERVKSGNNYINDREYIRYSDFETSQISGTAATASVVGDSLFASTPTYSFGNSLQRQVAFTFVAPESLKRKTKSQFRIYWTTSGVAGAVVWDANYRAYSLITSGTLVSGETYNISGAVAQAGNSTVTSTYTVGKPTTLSGVVQQSVLSIPAGDIKAGDFVKVQLFRDGIESADTLKAPAHLLGVLVEYIDG